MLLQYRNGKQKEASMPNVVSALKAEVLRLSSRVVRQATATLRKDSIGLKHAVADLKRRCAQAERAVKQIAKALPKPTLEVTDAEFAAARPTAKMVRGLRRKFRTSQAQFAKLVGVSANSVNLWEHKTGRLRMRDDTKRAILKVKKMTKQDVKAALGLK